MLRAIFLAMGNLLNIFLRCTWNERGTYWRVQQQLVTTFLHSGLIKTLQWRTSRREKAREDRMWKTSQEFMSLIASQVYVCGCVFRTHTRRWITTVCVCVRQQASHPPLGCVCVWGGEGPVGELSSLPIGPHARSHDPNLAACWPSWGHLRCVCVCVCVCVWSCVCVCVCVRAWA